MESAYIGEVMRVENVVRNKIEILRTSFILVVNMRETKSKVKVKGTQHGNFCSLPTH
jgi:hypothetical protein